MKSVSFVLNQFSQTVNIELDWLHIGTKGVNNLEMSSVSMISHEERLLQHWVYTADPPLAATSTKMPPILV